VANPVIIDFIARGIPDIQRALRTVEQATAAAERSSTRRAQQEATQRQRIADREAREKIRAMHKADQWHRQAQDRAVRETQRAATKETRARERAAREQIRLEERAAREVGRIKERAARDVERTLSREEAARNRAAARWVHQEERRRFIQSRDEMRNRRRFAGAVGGAFAGGLASGAQRIGGLAMGAANMVGQLGGGFSIADSVARNARNAGELVDLLDAGTNPFSQNARNRARRDRGEVEGVLDSTTTRYGLEREDAISGLRAWTSTTGDFDTGIKLLPKLAEMARAFGASLTDTTQAAANAAMQLDNIADGDEKAAKVLEIMRVVGGQGKAGAVEVRDLATQMAKMVAASGQFEGDNVENIMRMGMLAQAARGGGGAWSAASAATAITAFSSTFGKGARLKAFEAEGVEVFADKGRTKVRAPEQIIADALDKTKGDTKRMNDLFGSVMAGRAVGKFADIYKKGYTDTAGRELTGKDAVLGWAHDMMKSTAMSEKDVTQAANNRTAELDAQMASQREQFDNAVREKVIPALLKLVPEFEKLVPIVVDLNAKALPAFIDLIKTVADFADRNKDLINDIAAHPIGTILAAEVTRSVGQAMIGQIVANGIQKGFGDAGMGAIFQRVLSSQLGQAGLVVGAAAIAIQQGMVAIDNEYKKENELRDASRNDQLEAVQVAARLRRGTATDEERAQAAQLVTKLRTDATATQSAHDNPGFWKQLGGGLASFTDEGRQATLDEEATHQQAMGELTKTLRDLEQAIQANTGANKANSADTASGPNGAARAQSIVSRN
jgi:hypothetical protein